MKLSPEQLKAEEYYLRKTLEVLNNIIEKSSDSIDSRKVDIIEMKKYIWKNIGILDDIEVMKNMDDVNKEVDFTNKNIKVINSLKKSLISPYFGRIDFSSDDDIISIYIGINGIMKDLKNYVFDWRTPIASLFYNYGVGKAEYVAPGGIIKGDISLKRQYKISNGKIKRCFESDINIDDEYLQEILSSASSEKMTNIVNTIQKEQNVIIRNVDDKYLIVQGIAGSGKTSVALHRIAYLLYNEKNLTNNNVLIFSPNEVFSEYISNVLPELGEQNVLQTTFSDFASSYIDGDIETFTNFLERYYKNENIDFENQKYNKIKLSNEFKKEIDIFLKEYVSKARFVKGLSINGKKITREELDQIFQEKFNNRPISIRLDDMSEYLGGYKKEVKRKIFQKLKELLTIDTNPIEVYNKILSENNLTIDLEKTKFNSNGKIQKLSYSDLLPLMYINFELNGYPNARSIKHVIIDEAQDYTLLQFDILKKIFNVSSFTILGDINQTINPFYKYDNLNDINNIFNNKGKYIELTKTYRSSQEIIEFSNKILGIDNACSVRDSNSIPVEFGELDKNEISKILVENVHKMKEENMKRIAIITKNNDETLKLYKKLKKELPKLKMINTSKDFKIGNMVILPSYISKGLEFDGVIIYTDKENEYKEKDKYLFYVVCTRAQHVLSIYNQKEIIRKR
jgi:ATP-dependent DNA helicase replicase